MKLTEYTNETETFGEIQEQSFSIDEEDMGLMFEILRSKMYKNPIAAICREVASNSRDANREAKKSDTPIEIIITNPNPLLHISDKSIIFKDYGIGISPERMANVFVKYAASTKRNSNKFTGGFGLGAKTPFSYTDTFNIITVFDKKQYFYSAYIDESRKGKVVLFETKETEEPSGTSIVVPVKPQDLNTFEFEVITAMLFWTTKPILTGFKESFPTLKIKLKEKDFSIYESSSISKYFSPSRIILIDGIAYPFEKDDVNVKSPVLDSKIIYKFTNGDLTVAANRESVQFDQQTITKILDIDEKIVNYFTDLALKKIESYPSLWNAVVSLSKINYGQTSTVEDSIVSWYIKSANSIIYKGLDMREYFGIRLNYHSFVLTNSYTTKRNSLFSSLTHLNPELPIYVSEKRKIENRKTEAIYVTSKSFYLLKTTLIKEPDSTDLNILKPYKESLENLKKEKELLEKLQIEILSYDDVVPLKIERKKKEKVDLEIEVTYKHLSEYHSSPQTSSTTLLYYEATKTNSVWVNDKKIIYIPVESLSSLSPGERTKCEIAKEIKNIWKYNNVIVLNSKKVKYLVSPVFETIDQAFKNKNNDLKKIQEKIDLTCFHCSLIKNQFTKYENQDIDLSDEFKTAISIIKNISSLSNKVTVTYYAAAYKEFGITPSKELIDALEFIKNIEIKYPLLQLISGHHFHNYSKTIKEYVELIDEKLKK